MVTVMCASQRDERNLFHAVETEELEVRRGWGKRNYSILARE